MVLSGGGYAAGATEKPSPITARGSARYVDLIMIRLFEEGDFA